MTTTQAGTTPTRTGNGHTGGAPSAIILAAGKGTRMRSDLPKVAHPVGGRPMVCAVVDACRAAGCERIVLVVGYQQEVIRKAVADQGAAWAAGIEFAEQTEQLGTGHAVRCAESLFAEQLGDGRRHDVFVLAGDGPLIRGETLRKLLSLHRSSRAGATLATAVIDDPTGYGRIVRGGTGRLERIVEHKECSPEQLRIREVNPSYYCFDLATLFSTLADVKRNPQSGEYYITDVPAMLLTRKGRVEVIDAVPPEDVLSINTPEQLAEVDRIYRSRGGSRPGLTIGPASGAVTALTGQEHPVSALRVFAGRGCGQLVASVCQAISACAGLPFSPSPARTESFPDGEIIVKVDDDVRGKDCFVVLSTSTPVNDNLMELLVYIDCLRRASARRITAVIPYFGYARQDRKDEGRVPITAKLVANLITAARADRVMAVDLHAAQLQGFFDLPVDHLTASPVLVEYFLSRRPSLGDLCLVSPDVGNVKVAESFANLLGGELAIINKRRVSGTEVVTDAIIGNVRGKTVLMVDDMIATGGTVVQAAELVMRSGAKRVIVAATHAVMSGAAVAKLAASPIEQVVVTDTIPGRERLEPLGQRVVELPVGPLLGEAIYRVHHDMSVSALFKTTAGVKR